MNLPQNQDGRRNRGRQRLAPEIERAIWEAEQRRLAHLQAAKALTRERIADELGIAKRTVAKALRRMERARRREGA